MKKFMSVMACLCMLVSLAGCGGSSDSGKTFTFSSELDIQTLDSSLSDDGMSFNAMHACIDGLMGLDKDGNIVEALAKDYEVSDDGLTYTFNLRDAKWSNGAKVTADDFVYAWQRIIDTAGNYAYMIGSDGASVAGADELMEKQAEGPLKQEDLDTLGIKADGDQKLVITLTRKVPYFLELMTFPCYYPINRDFAKKAGDKYGKNAENLISCGAFVMSEWTKGNKATYTKNKDYWNADAVKIDTLVMNLVQDPKTAAAGFDSGNTDFCPINSSLVDKYKGKDTYHTYNEGYLFYLSLNFKNTDLANLNVRKALSYAIDRKDFADNILKDGSKAAKGFIPSQLSTSPDGKDFREEGGTYLEFDSAKAQAALDAGLKELGKTSIKLRLLYGTDESPMDQLATYLQNAFAKLNGIEIEMVATTKNDRIYNKQKGGEFDIACTRWGPDYGDPTTYLNLLLSDNSNNYGKYLNTAYDEAMDKVQNENDESARWQNMLAAEKVAMEDLAYIPVFEKGTAALMGTNVKNLVHRPVGVPYTFNYVELK